MQTSTGGLRRREAALAVLACVDGVRRTPEEAAAQALAVGLGYKWAAVCRHASDDAEAELLAFWDGGRFGEPGRHALAGTPYEALAAGDGVATLEHGARERFPADAMLAARGAEAYQGRIVYDPETGEVAGHVFAFDDAGDAEGADDLVEIVARWIGMEFSRVRALRTLAESEARFRDWAQASSDWFWEADTEHRFTSIVGRTDKPLRLGALERLVGITPWEIPDARPEDDPTWRRHKAEIRARRPFRDLVVVSTTEDGEPFVTSASGVPVFDHDGAFRGYRGATRDVTEQYLARQEIERVEHQFRSVMDGAPIPITIVAKRSGRVTYGNPKWRAMTGVPESELGTVTVFEFYRDASEREELMRRLEREGDVRNMPVTFHGRDGTTLPVLLSAQLIDYGGEEAVISAFVDIREQLDVEAALRESEQRYALAMLGSGESLWDWKTGEDQIFVDPRLLRALGLPDDTSCLDAETLFDRIHPDDRRAYDEVFRRVLSARDQRQIEIEFRLRMGDGGYRWHRGRGMPLRNAEGRVYRIAGSVADVTEQKLAAEALRESEERYALAMEGAGEHLWDWHAGSEALFVDPRILVRMGFPSDPPMVDRHVLLAAIHPEDRGAYVAAFQDHLRGRAPQFDVEFRLRMAGDDYRWHRCRGVALRDDAGRVYRVAGSTADIADRVEAANALKEKDERLAALQQELQQVARASAMGEMASAIAHEVNQPLAAVMNYVQAARDLLDAVEGARLSGASGLLDKAVDQAERAATIIRGLRNFFVRGELEVSNEDLNELIEDTVSLALTQGPDSQVTLELSLDEKLPTVAIDRIQIQQVVLNLVRNAAEAMREAPVQRLVVHTRAAKGRVEVEVQDSGPGIPDTVAERLFEPFVTSKPEGMGIGLSIAHSIVRAHGGTLEAAAGPGGGTVFRFSIPLPPTRE